MTSGYIIRVHYYCCGAIHLYFVLSQFIKLFDATIQERLFEFSNITSVPLPVVE